MARLGPVAFALFVAGGLVSGMLGVSNLALFADLRDVPTQTSTRPPEPVPTPIAMRPAFPISLLDQLPSDPLSGRIPLTANAVDTPAMGRWSLLYAVDGDLWLAAAGAPVELTHDGHIGQPALGDGALAFVERSRDASDIWLASADEAPRAVTHDVASRVSQNHWATQPAFVPGRPRLYALADFDKASTGVGDLAVWEVSLEPGPPIQITRPTAYTGGDQDVTVDPHDAGRVVFTRYAYDGTQLVEQLEWLDIATDTLVPLTNTDTPSRQAAYSPDGTELAFVQRGDDMQDALFVAPVQIDNKRVQLGDPQLVATGGVANPVWTPDGETLAYIGATHDGFQILSVDAQRDADGTESFSEPHQMTSGPSVDATSRPVYLSREQADQVRQWLAAPAT
jgi:hypothetical protein